MPPELPAGRKGLMTASPPLSTVILMCSANLTPTGGSVAGTTVPPGVGAAGAGGVGAGAAGAASGTAGGGASAAGAQAATRAMT